MAKMNMISAECSKGFADKAFNLEVIIDGKKLKNPEQYRIASLKGGFKFEAVENNPFETPQGHGTGVSDGFWVLMAPLSPGKHKISFKGTFDLSPDDFTHWCCVQFRCKGKVLQQ